MATGGSRHLNSARSKNFNIQRKYAAELDKLDKEWELSRSRIATERKSLLRTLDDVRLGPSSGSGMALPRGLTDEEKARYLEINSRQQPSISLAEFDRKMARWKAERQYMRYQGQALFCRHVHPRSGSHYLSPNKSLQISGTFRLQSARAREFNQGVTRPLSAIPGTGPPRVRRGSSSCGPRRTEAEVKEAENRIKSAARRRPTPRSKSTLPGY